MKYIVTIGEEQFTVDISRFGEILLNGEVIQADMQPTLDPTLHSIIIDNKSHDVRIHADEGAYSVQVGGEIYEVVVEDERTHRLAGLKSSLGAMTGEAVIKAPMPGVIVDILVKEGQAVIKGDTVVVLESMKMQNEFKTPRDGTVHAIRVTKGDKVDQNAILLTIA